jgi:hypothetical protein
LSLKFPFHHSSTPHRLGDSACGVEPSLPGLARRRARSGSARKSPDLRSQPRSPPLDLPLGSGYVRLRTVHHSFVTLLITLIDGLFSRRAFQGAIFHARLPEQYSFFLAISYPSIVKYIRNTNHLSKNKCVCLRSPGLNAESLGTVSHSITCPLSTDHREICKNLCHASISLNMVLPPTPPASLV